MMMWKRKSGPAAEGHRVLRQQLHRVGQRAERLVVMGDQRPLRQKRAELRGGDLEPPGPLLLQDHLLHRVEDHEQIVAEILHLGKVPFVLPPPLAVLDRQRMQIEEGDQDGLLFGLHGVLQVDPEDPLIPREGHAQLFDVEPSDLVVDELEDGKHDVFPLRRAVLVKYSRILTTFKRNIIYYQTWLMLCFMCPQSSPLYGEICTVLWSRTMRMN